MVESIGKLRKAAKGGFDGARISVLDNFALVFDSVKGTTYEQALLAVADEIEAEIAERYMELPADIEGEPIHVDDVMAFSFGTAEVCGVSEDKIFILRDGKWMCLTASKYQHAKTRTLEDVLQDLMKCYAFTEDTAGNIAAKYAAEIRELLGVDAE